MKHNEIYNFTPREWKNHIKGFENRRKEKWEQVRFMTYNVMISNGLTERGFKPTDLIKFAWDDDQKVINLTKKKYNEIEAELKSKGLL